MEGRPRRPFVRLSVRYLGTLLTSFLGHLASKLWKISSANDFVMGLTPEHPDAGPASGKVGM